MRALIGLVFAGCAARDEDFDGFAAGDDCDDLDPFVYPGAPDTPGDGLDADCADGDPALGIVGGWEVTSFEADYSGYVLIRPDSASGTMTVADDLATALEVAVTLELYDGFSLTMAFDGAASSVPGPDTYVLFADAEVYGEEMYVDWDCTLADVDLLACVGELKALQLGWLSTATFERAP